MKVAHASSHIPCSAEKVLLLPSSPAGGAPTHPWAPGLSVPSFLCALAWDVPWNCPPEGEQLGFEPHPPRMCREGLDPRGRPRMPIFPELCIQQQPVAGLMGAVEDY